MFSKKSRARVINFRLTDSEYESIVFACHAEGVRSVSEFAREIVLSRARGETAQRGDVSQWLLALSYDFAKLKANIAQILEVLQTERKIPDALVSNDFGIGSQLSSDRKE